MRRRELLRSSVSLAAALLPVRPGFAMSRLARRQSVGATRSAVLRPYRIEFGREALAALRRRLDETRWPAIPFETGWSQGTNDRVLRELVSYWRHSYDWTAVQSRLNSLTHLRGAIQGEQLHCVTYAATGGVSRPYPLLLMSGWPGSFLEFAYAAPLLAQQGYRLVIPSLPGFVFSEPARAPGMNTTRMAERMHVLMREMGFERYGIAGSDWGALIGTILARQQPDAVQGLHLTLATAAPPAARVAGGASSSPVSPRPDQRSRDNGWQPGNNLQSASPQTLGYALEDSPVGFLSWILMRYWSQSDHGPDADLWDVFKKDDILTTAMLYWLPGHVLSSIRLYWETFTNTPTAAPPFSKVTVPTAYARFQGAVPLGPTREAVEPAYHLVRYTEPPRGGHFAALEQPQAFADDVAAFFSSL